MSSNKHAQEELKNLAYRMIDDYKVWVIPYANVQEKKPLLPWQEYQDEEFNEDKVNEILKTVDWSKVDGLGILLGPPSQYTIMLDFDIPKCKKPEVDDYKCYELHEALYERVLRAADEIFVEYGAVQTIHQGLHILIRLSKEDWGKLKEIVGTCKTKLGQIRAGANTFDVELMLCKTVTPIRGQGYDFFNPFIPTVTLDHVKTFVNRLGLHLGKSEQGTGNRQSQTTTTPTPGVGKRLGEQEIGRIVEILKNYWVPGHRNNLQLSLLGWLIKRRVPVEDAVKLFDRLCDAAGDEEKRKRLDEVQRQYGLVETGQKPVEQLLGKAGLLNELMLVIQEQNPGLSEEEVRDRALSVISELEKVLGPRRTILVRTPYKTNTWFVNDPKRGIVLLKERRNEDGEVRRSREYISDWYIKRLLVTRGEGQYNYRVLFVNARTKEKLVLTGQMDEIARELRRIHGVKRSQVITDAVSAIISELIRRKVAKLRKTAAAPGIVPAKDGVKLVRVATTTQLLIPREPDLEKAKLALNLLVKLREHYDTRKFDVAINWAGYAPLGYALKKHFRVKQVYLMLHGERHTGKSTLADIIKTLYPLPDEDDPEEGLSEYRMGYKLNLATTPVLEDEAEGFSKKPAVIALIKRAATNIIARWRGDTGRKYFARAALILVSNRREILADPGAVERIIAIEFTHADYVGNKSREEREEFEQVYNKYRLVAPYLGAVILQTIVKNWNEIAEYWPHQLQEKRDYLKLGQWLWQKVAEHLGVEPPPWAAAEIKLEEENPDELVEEAFWSTLHDILTEYSRFNKCDSTLLGCVAQLGEKGLLPTSIIEWSPSKLVVKSPILKELERRLDVPVFGGLRGLAEKLGLEYKSVRMRGKITKGIVVPISELVKRIGGQDDVVEYLAEVLLFKYNMERWGEDDNGVAPHVIEEARKLGIEVDRQTAYRVATKLFVLANKRRTPEAEYLELEEVTA